MATLSLTTKTHLLGSLLKSPDLTTAKETIDITSTTALTSGTGASQANEFFSDRRTTSGADNLDVVGTTLANAFADNLALTNCKHLLVLNNSTTATQLVTVSGTGLTNILGGTSPTIKVGPSGGFHWWSPLDGADLTAGTGDVITVDGGGTSITYNIILVGLT